MQKIFLVLVMLFLSACGGHKVEGVYADESEPRYTIEFKPNGKVLIASPQYKTANSPVSKHEGSYSTKGSEITLAGFEMPLAPFSLQDDGSFIFYGQHFIKK